MFSLCSAAVGLCVEPYKDGGGRTVSDQRVSVRPLAGTEDWRLSPGEGLAQETDAKRAVKASQAVVE